MAKKVTQAAVAKIASRAMRDPESITCEERKIMGASLLSQTEAKVAKSLRLEAERFLGLKPAAE